MANRKGMFILNKMAENDGLKDERPRYDFFDSIPSKILKIS